MPTLWIATSTAIEISTIFSDFVNSTCTLGDRFWLVRMRDSVNVVKYSATDSSTASDTVERTIV